MSGRSGGGDMKMSSYLVVDHRYDNAKYLMDEPPTKAAKTSIAYDTLLGKYNDLPLPEDKIMATYIWIDGTGEHLRSKDRTLHFIPRVPKDKFTRVLEEINKKIWDEAMKDIKNTHTNKYLPPYFRPQNLENIYKVQCSLRAKRNMGFFEENLKDLPIWSFDGSATGHADSITNSDFYLFPRAMFRDPFRGGNNILVMCDTFDEHLEPTVTNSRVSCLDAYEKCREDEPLFGIKQEYFLVNCHDGRPLGWPTAGFPNRERRYQFATGCDRVFGRELAETHYRCCLFAGIPCSGYNYEIAPSQWDFRMGPSLGVNAADELCVARYILDRLAEEYGVLVTYDPKLLKDWNGSGAHINFSTKKMRGENGIIEIERAIFKLERLHSKHMKLYDSHEGKDNARRLIGTNKTGTFEKFTIGFEDRNTSVRIPRQVADHKKGYLEDRRPASNCNPYCVLEALMRTCILNE